MVNERRTMKSQVSKLLAGSVQSTPPFFLGGGLLNGNTWHSFSFRCCLLHFLLFPSAELPSRSHQVYSSLLGADTMRHNVVVVFFSLLAAGWMLFTVALHYSNGLIFLKASGSASQFFFYFLFLSLSTSTESRLQLPATTWQLKTAHYKKSKKKNPCLMFLLSEGGSAISSHPLQAFSFIRKFCLRLAGIWYACSLGVMRELNMANCVDGVLRENSRAL